jgi:protein-S-isoprenylcysteine O-methyltransferase Ste14
MGAGQDVFQFVLIAVLLLTGLIALPTRIKSRTSETLDRRREGLFILSTLRPAGILCWLAVLACAFRPSWMSWSSLPLPHWLRWVGVALWAVAAALLAWTFHHLGRNLTDTVVTRREHELITDGPYRYVRNPFYDAAALLTLSVSLIAANWCILVSGTVVLLLLVLRTRTEEAHLIARFGDDYRSYMQRTGRFLPWTRA